MSLNISNHVRISLNTAKKGEARADFGTAMLVTPESGNVFTDDRTHYTLTTSLAEVASMFGVNSQTYAAAAPYFLQEPAPQQLAIGRWQKSALNVPATSNALNGAVLSNALNEFKKVNNGFFSFVVNNTEHTITGLDFSQCADFNAVAVKITSKIASLNLGATYDAAGNRFIIKATNAGDNAATRLSYLKEDTSQSGAYVGSLLKLEDGQATKITGAKQTNVFAESLEEAIEKINNNFTGFYALFFAAQLTNEQFISMGKWAQANKKFVFFNAIKASHLDNEDSNPFKQLKNMNLTRVFTVFDKDELYTSHASAAKLAAVDFSANNSVITLKFKQLTGSKADTITQSEYKKANYLNLNTYAIHGSTAMLANGVTASGSYADETLIADWFADAAQKAVFNRLIKTATKIPYTDEGQQILISAIINVCNEGRNNGAFAPGKWEGDPIGYLKNGDYLEEGFYIYSASTDEASENDRDARRAPPIQCALNLAGAIHSANIIINFDR